MFSGRLVWELHVWSGSSRRRRKSSRTALHCRVSKHRTNSWSEKYVTKTFYWSRFFCNLFFNLAILHRKYWFKFMIYIFGLCNLSYYRNSVKNNWPKKMWSKSFNERNPFFFLQLVLWRRRDISVSLYVTYHKKNSVTYN